jgi:hypothetical protein
LKAVSLGKYYYRVCQNSLNFSFKPAIPDLPRRLESAYIQLKTSIGYQQAYLAVIGKAEKLYCNKCSKNTRQTTIHLLLYCTAYAVERKEMKKTLERLPISLQTLFCTSAGKQALAKFVLKTEICTAQWLQGVN